MEKIVKMSLGEYTEMNRLNEFIEMLKSSNFKYTVEVGHDWYRSVLYTNDEIVKELGSEINKLMEEIENLKKKNKSWFDKLFY